MTGDALAFFPAEPIESASRRYGYSLRELHYLRHTMRVMLDRHPDSSLCDHRRHMLAYYEAELAKITRGGGDVHAGSTQSVRI